MGIFSFLKNLFRKEELSEEELKKLNPDTSIESKEIEINDSESKQIKELEHEADELKIEESENIEGDESQVDEEQNEVKIKDNKEESLSPEPIEKLSLTVEEISTIGSLSLDMESLALDKLESESEAVNSYLKMLMKDLSIYQDNKNNKEKQELYCRSISTKIKKISMHSLEINNLLGMIKTHYFDVLLEPLRKLNSQHNSQLLSNFISSLESNLELIQNLEAQLSKVIAYDELFNPEKNKDFMKQVDSEVSKGKINSDASELYSNLTQSLSKSSGIRAKIEKSNILEKLQSLVSI